MLPALGPMATRQGRASARAYQIASLTCIPPVVEKKRAILKRVCDVKKVAMCTSGKIGSYSKTITMVYFEDEVESSVTLGTTRVRFPTHPALITSISLPACCASLSLSRTAAPSQPQLRMPLHMHKRSS